MIVRFVFLVGYLKVFPESMLGNQILHFQKMVLVIGKWQVKSLSYTKLLDLI